jgi:hypothetical protein
MNCCVPLPSRVSLHYAWVWLAQNHSGTPLTPHSHFVGTIILFLHEVIILYCFIWYSRTVPRIQRFSFDWLIVRSWFLVSKVDIMNLIIHFFDTWTNNRSELNGSKWILLWPLAVPIMCLVSRTRNYFWETLTKPTLFKYLDFRR